MAETLTVDSTPDAEIVGEEAGVQLTAEEKDSLQLGEKMVDQQEKLLAGKYKDAEALEKAYIDLQKKFGEDGKEEVSESEPEEKTSKDVSPQAELITEAAEEYAESGDIKPETLAKFAGMSSEELVKAYMEVQKDLPAEASEDSEYVGADISDSDVNVIKNAAGGEQAYQNMVNWAGQNLDPQSIQAFDNIVSSGSVDAIKLAVGGLKSQYLDANGYEGKMLTGKAPSNTKDTFRSQAELVKAMNDRRYDEDPAYRQDIMAKLDRSNNLQF